MTPPQKKRTGVRPEWANLPKRCCDDCGAKYKPVKPLREGERGFCTATCRKAYHKHGGAYRKLRVEVEKLVDKRLRKLVRDELTALLDSLEVVIHTGTYAGQPDTWGSIRFKD